jgi:DNA topoisomerase-1
MSSPDSRSELGPSRHVFRPPGLHRLTARPAAWVDDEGEPVVDEAILDRLSRLGIPPAWVHVWAAADPDNPIQATGIDARGRTQYRYSDEATRRAAERKFGHLLQFAAALPRLREQVATDLAAALAGDGPVHARAVTATVVRLLDRGLFRVGNERYARDNHTYGLTTLRRSQVLLTDDSASFDFVGKEHIEHHLTVADPASVAVLRALVESEGETVQPLFATAAPPPLRHIDSATVNSYIHAHADAGASAKTFRTWGATVAAAAVAGGATFDGAKTGRADLVAYDAAAFLLGDTRTVARASYIHPRALEVGATAAVQDAVRSAADDARSSDVRAVLHHAEVQRAVYEQLLLIESTE